MSNILDLATEHAKKCAEAAAKAAEEDRERAKLLASLPAKSGYPIVNDALACHPKMRDFYAKKLAGLGVPTEVNKRGQVIVRNPAHYKELRRALKVHHNEAYYD